MKTVEFPHAAWCDDGFVEELRAGMERGTVADCRAFDVRRRHVTRAEIERRIAAAAARESVAVMTEYGTIPTPGEAWAIAIGMDAPAMSGTLGGWLPYSLGRIMMRARARKDYAKADAIREKIAADYAAEVRIGRDAVLIAAMGALA